MKKGQVSIIVIVAIIIAILAGMVFLQTKYELFYKPPAKDPIADKLANSFSLFVDDCLENTAIDAFELIGESGGYIEFPSNTKRELGGYDSDVYFENPNEIAYWYYLDSENVPSSMMPPLCKGDDYCMGYLRGENSIQEQVEDYIKANIKTCFNGFESMNDVMIIEEIGELEPSIEFQNNEVVVKLDYPVKVNNAANNDYTNVNKYEVVLGLNFLDIYDAAYELTMFEANSSMFEEKTLNLMSIYEGLDSAKNIPPAHDMQFFLSDKMPVWSLYGVKDMLENDVLSYVNFFQAYNSNNYELVPVVEHELREDIIGIYGGMVFDFSEKQYDLDIDFEYNYDPIDLNINDAYILKGLKYESESSSSNPIDNVLTSLVGTVIKRYDFYYDISYPLVVDFEDTNAYNGDGYKFSIAYEVNIQDNKPAVSGLSFSDVSAGYSVEYVTPASLIDREIRVSVFDNYTGNSIDDVNVFYRCQDEEFVGITKNIDGLSYASFKLPYCPIGGRLIFRHDNYMDDSMIFLSDEFSSDSRKVVNLNYKLWPLKEKEIEVFKRTESDLEALDNGDYWADYDKFLTPLEDNEIVYLTISRNKKNIYEQDIPMIGMVVFKNDDSSIMASSVNSQIDLLDKSLKEGVISQVEYDEWKLSLDSISVNNSNNMLKNKVQLAPGDYNLNAFLIDNNKFTIPKRTLKICSALGCPLGTINDWGECSDSCLHSTTDKDLDEQNFTSFVTAQINHNISISKNELYDYDSYLKLILYQLDKPTTWDQFMKWEEPLVYQFEKETESDYRWVMN
jgi:hypothetical protein